MYSNIKFTLNEDDLKYKIMFEFLLKESLEMFPYRLQKPAHMSH